MTKSCWQACTLNLHGESKQREITLGGRDSKELTWQIDRQVQSLRLLLAMVPIASYSLNCNYSSFLPINPRKEKKKTKRRDPL